MSGNDGGKSTDNALPEPPNFASDDPLRTAPYEQSLALTPQPDIALGPLVFNNRYELHRLIGRGGMGEVYLGTDLVLQRPVALKVIRPRDPGLRDISVHSAAFKDAFIEEARIGANLTHPAIATVFDFGFHRGEPFIVFEYIDGDSLRAVISQRGSMPLEDVRLVVGPLAQALDFAHSRQIVHRDLKPDNIRATSQGHFKLLDLGLAKEFPKQSDWRFAGTLAYASPEQIAGLPCDGRTDQYALALITYEMLTGRRLLSPDNQHPLLSQRPEQELLSTLGIAIDVLGSAYAVLSRALHHDPNQRFGNCAEFAVALGCQLITVPLDTADTIYVTRIPGDLISKLHYMASCWLIKDSYANYVALCSDGIRLVARGFINYVPYCNILNVQHDRKHTALCICYKQNDQVDTVKIGFFLAEECRQHFEIVTHSVRSLNNIPRDGTASHRCESTLLMGRPPQMRYQVLGVTEFSGPTADHAQVGLQVRAAMMGADAVVGVQEEYISLLDRSLHRRSGTAIKVVDANGTRQLHLRRIGLRLAEIANWMTLLIGLSVVFSIIYASIEWMTRLKLDGSVDQPISIGLYRPIGRLAVVTIVLYSWPFAVSSLLRHLLWPQLLRPCALAMLGAAVSLVATLAQWYAGSALRSHENTFGSLVNSAVFIAILSVAVVVMDCLLARRAWRTLGGYQSLVVESEEKISMVRRVCEPLALALSCGYLVLVGAYVVCAVWDAAGNDTGLP